MGRFKKHLRIEFEGSKYGIETMRMLVVVKKLQPARVKDIGEMMWSKSSAHTKKYGGKGDGGKIVEGKGAWLSAGSYLAKLAAKGLVKRHATYPSGKESTTVLVEYTLTKKGKRCLTELVQARNELKEIIANQKEREG